MRTASASEKTPDRRTNPDRSNFSACSAVSTPAPHSGGRDAPLEGTLPIADIYPPVELEAHLLEVGHFGKTVLLMQGDARLVGQCDSGHDSMDASGLKYREQPIV